MIGSAYERVYTVYGGDIVGNASISEYLKINLSVYL